MKGAEGRRRERKGRGKESHFLDQVYVPGSVCQDTRKGPRHAMCFGAVNEY